LPADAFVARVAWLDEPHAAAGSNTDLPSAKDMAARGAGTLARSRRPCASLTWEATRFGKDRAPEKC